MLKADRLNALIAAVRRRWFITVALRTAGAGLAAAALPLLAGLGVYWMFAPAGAALLVLVPAAAVMSIAAAFLVMRRMEPRPDDTRVARFIEERAGQLPAPQSMDDCVVSAVQASALPPADARRPFADLVIAAALRRLNGIDAPALIPSAAIRGAAAAGLGGVALMALALVLGAPAMVQSWDAARLQLFPQSISVEVLPGDVRIAAGLPLSIKARLLANGLPFAAAKPRLVVSSGADERTVEMTADGEGFTFAFDSIDRTFHYRVTAGAVSSNDYTVTALFAPRVTRIDLQYRYPSFTGLAPRSEDDGGDIYGPAGTRVRLAIHTDKPVASGQLGMAKGFPELRRAGERVLEADLVVARDDSYRIHLRDHDGLASDGDTEYFIRVMEDRPPDVRILRPSGDQGITPLQEISIEARAEDDYGVASLDLVYSVGGGKEHVVPFTRLAGGDTQRTGAHLLAAEDLNVRPGDVIAYYARARDVARGRRATETKSDLFFLEIKPFNEEFVAAQSQAGASASGDPQIDSLIEAQKDIISATWNIERRSVGGRSADDVKAIARAQADLKARAERVLASTPGRRGRGLMPPQRPAAQVPPSRGGVPGDPVAAAVEAMTRAVEELVSTRTREAIPHEMSALNGLLQAQAEVRRRQITQQARGSGSGGNRQTQDLSALFDKELQRQQQTNYEQRSQVEERQPPSQSEQAMADRIKDLARRQEELSRQQQQLAAMPAEQRRRELERLAREQQELRRQTEELSKQMPQPSTPQRGSQSGQQSQPQGPQPGPQRGQQQSGQPAGQGSAGMRSAAEQMRRAADDMRRNAGESAARNGQRAADELRQLEQDMRGGADARQRAAADLQAEAQQIAQEQRRIASEAERMEQSGSAGGTEPRRRLAADKDRLSERVDALKRDAQRLAVQPSRPTPPGQPRSGGSDKTGADERGRARAAAGELDRQRVAERMRETAQQMRDGATPPSARSEGALAKALEQVVEKLGGAAPADTRKLAEQLDRSREIRERLDQLETQMRAAAGTQDGQSQKLRQQYEQELGRARAETMGPRAGSEQRDGSRGSTPEQPEHSRSAPGTEAFKQDRSGWESLRKDVNRALEARDAAVSRQLSTALAEDRFNAGGSERVPERYRGLVAKYYESLARAKK